MSGELVLKRPLVIFDLETTGVDVEADRIVELGVVRVDGDDIRTREWRLNPGRPIPPEATAVHGITDADVRAMPTFRDVAVDVYETLNGCDLAGFNVRAFDLPMLVGEFGRVGMDSWPSSAIEIVDAFRVFTRCEPHTLVTAVRTYLGREHALAHSASGDAMATLEVLRAQAERYGVSTLDELAVLERHPDWLDREGKIKWVGDVAVIGFGKWAGRPLSQVDRGYLRWMLDGNFPADVKEIVGDAIKGRFPVRAAASPADPEAENVPW